jgi:medium-chain acyl-[acyl-carrier-protein] hydrolase
VVYSIGEWLPKGRRHGRVSSLPPTGSAVSISWAAQSWLENFREAAMTEPQQPAGRAHSASALRLVCLPHAGGSSLPFAGWQRWMPAGVLVLAAALPGRGERRREPPPRRFDDLVEDLAGRLAPRLDGPFALFGHSFGALLAFELARVLPSVGCQQPRLLAVAGRNGPTLPASGEPMHALPDREFAAAIQQLGGTPGDMLDDDDLLAVFAPVLRADLRLAETYQRRPGPPLRCPVAVYAGVTDPLVDAGGLAAWHGETTAGAEVSWLEGGHFVLDSPAFRAALVGRLARLVVSAGHHCR